MRVRARRYAIWGAWMTAISLCSGPEGRGGQEAPSPRPSVSLSLAEAPALQALKATTQALETGFVAGELPPDAKPFELKEATREAAAEAFAGIYGCEVVDWGDLWVVAYRPPEEDEPLLTFLLDGMAQVARLKSPAERDQKQQRLKLLLLEEVPAPERASLLPMSALSANAQRLVKEVVQEYLLGVVEDALKQMALYADFSAISGEATGFALHTASQFSLSLPAGRGELLSRQYAEEPGQLDMARLWRQERAPLEVRDGNSLLLEQRVSLESDAAAFLEVLRQLSEQTSLQILGDQAQEGPALSMAVGEVPLWTVLDALSLLSGRLWRPQTDSLAYTLAEPSTLYEHLYHAAPVSFRTALLQWTRMPLSHVWGDLAFLALPDPLRTRLEKGERVPREALPPRAIHYLTYQVQESFLPQIFGGCLGFDYPVRTLLQVERGKEGGITALQLLVGVAWEKAPGASGPPCRYGAPGMLEGSWTIDLTGLKREQGQLRGPEYSLYCPIYRDFCLRPRPKNESLGEEGGETDAE